MGFSNSRLCHEPVGLVLALLLSASIQTAMPQQQLPLGPWYKAFQWIDGPRSRVVTLPPRRSPSQSPSQHRANITDPPHASTNKLNVPSATPSTFAPPTRPAMIPPVMDFPATQEVIAVMMQSIIPALASTTLGRPSLSPTFLTLLSAAHKLAALPGLDQFPSVAPHLPATNTDQSGASSTSDPASQPPYLSTISMEGHMEPAVMALQAALQEWGSALCNVSATVAGARRITNGTVLPEVHGKGMLREVAVVRRLVVAIMHALDLWAVRGEGGVMGGAGAGDSAQRGRDSAGVGSTASSSAINGSSRANAGTGEPTVPGTQPASGALHRLIRSAGRSMLLALRVHEACARQAKHAVMVLHVSKSGGTSMCELARLGGVKNGLHDATNNCKIMSMGTHPKWLAKFPPAAPKLCIKEAPGQFWMLRKPCPAWLELPEMTCPEREQLLVDSNVNYIQNELGLPGSRHDAPGAANTCSGWRTGVLLRDPLERIASHIAHIRRLIRSSALPWCRKVLKGAGRKKSSSSWTRVPSSLETWSLLSPMLTDNYLLRHLLGRHSHCRTSTLANTTLTSAFTSLDAAQGAATLLQFDFLVAALAGDAAAGHEYDSTQGTEAGTGTGAGTGAGALTGAGAGALTGLLATYHGEIVLRVALGWPHGLATIAGRVHPKPHGLEEHMGFPPGTAAALRMLNVWDGAVVALGARLAALDAAALATLAVLEGEAEPSDRGMPSEADLQSPAEDTGSIKMNSVWAQYQAWASSMYAVPDEPIKAPLSTRRKKKFLPPPPPPLPLLPHLLLFGTGEGLPDRRLVFKTTIRGEALSNEPATEGNGRK